jgi:hypothetical protein
VELSHRSSWHIVTIVRAIGLTAAIALASLPFVLMQQYSRVTSPDKHFFAIATFPLWQTVLPLTPGSAGDKSGFITIFTAEGHSCGQTAVDMVSFIQDLQWTASTGTIPMVGEWNLLRCRLQQRWKIGQPQYRAAAVPSSISSRAHC